MLQDTILPAINRFDELVKAFTENSKEMNELALLVLAGSILIILSTDYIKPPSKKVRLIYLLFIPAWACLAYSVYVNQVILRRSAAYLSSGSAGLRGQIASKMNEEYINQLSAFQAAIIVLALWLTCYLIWWIFHQDKKKKEQNKTL